jgi:two-component system response regulator LytT
MNCIIIDDDATARLIISQLCEKSEWINVLAEFSSAINAIKYLNSNTVDLVYLDIHMPTFSGFDFIQTLKNPPKIILTTSDKNLALEAFEYKSVIDYLVKPISKERFNKSLEKLKIFSIEEENAS